MSQTPLDHAILEAGSGAALAKVLGVTPMAVSYWKVRGVPARHVIGIEQATGISRYRLRPDIYPEPAPTLNANVARIGNGDESSENAVDASSAESQA